MSEKFSHILITRFNLKNKDWDSLTKNKSTILTDDWMKERFKLFLDFCFPSVMNQSELNFEWWVFFDVNTSTEYKSIINNLSQEHKLFKAIYAENMEFFLPEIQQKLSKLSSPFVITSRIDNDDAIHEDYIKFIQIQFDYQKFMAIDLVDGYTLQIAPKIKMGLKKHIYNPFISVIEKNENASSVWSRNHGDWKKEKNLKRIENQRLWMSVIHDSNKVNEYTGFGNVNYAEVLSEFNVEKEKIAYLTEKMEFNFWEEKRNRIAALWSVFYKDFKKKLGKYG